MDITITDAARFPDVTFDFDDGVGASGTITLSLTGAWALPVDATGDAIAAILATHATAHIAGLALEAAAKTAPPAALAALVGKAKIGVAIPAAPVVVEP